MNAQFRDNAGDAPDAAPPDDAGKPPHLDESVRRIGRHGRATVDAALDTGRSLRRLVFADLALARSALGRALAWVAVAIVFGASACLLGMAALIALLQAFGLSWLGAIAIACAVTLAVTGLAAWRVSRFFEYAGLHATRRQLARLGIGDEGDDEAEHAANDGAAAGPEAR